MFVGLRIGKFYDLINFGSQTKQQLKLQAWLAKKFCVLVKRKCTRGQVARSRNFRRLMAVLSGQDCIYMLIEYQKYCGLAINTKVINIGRGLGILSFVKNPPQKMKGSSMASPCILCRQDPDQLEIEDGSAEDPPPPAPLEDQAVAEPGAEPEVREPVTIATDTESESESGHGGGSQPVVGGSTDALCGSPVPPVHDDVSEDDGKLSPKTSALLAEVDESIHALKMEEKEREAQENLDIMEATQREPEKSDSPQPELERNPSDSEDSVDPEDKKEDLHPYEGDGTSHGKGNAFDDTKGMQWLQSQVADLKRRRAAKMLTLLKKRSSFHFPHQNQ